MAERRLLIGTYTWREAEGLYWGRLDDSSGAFECAGLAARTPSPSFVARQGERIYAVNELEEGALSVFDLIGDDLTPKGRVASRGVHPCHLCATAEWIAVANYTSGSVATFSPDLAPIDFVQHEGSGPDARRQESAHAHGTYVTPDGGLLVPDLGTDRLVRYSVSGGALGETPGVTPVEPGAGPRHVAFHPRRPVVYLINELDNTIDVYAWGAAAMRRLQRVSTLPADFTGASATAEIQISADGRRLYGSNRGHDSIATFAVDPDGRLRALGHVPTLGAHPRFFCLDPEERWLLVANQNDDNVVVYRLEDGVPVEAVCNAPAPTPVCLLFL